MLRSVKMPVGQQRLLRGQHMHGEEVEAEPGEHRFGDDLVRAEPVLGLATVERELQAGQRDRQDGEARPVEARHFPFVLILHEEDDADGRRDAEGQVDEENIAPVVEVGQVAAECRARGSGRASRPCPRSTWRGRASPAGRY